MDGGANKGPPQMPSGSKSVELWWCFGGVRGTKLNADRRTDIGSKNTQAFTARMDYYLGLSIEIGEIGVAHAWFQCHEKKYFEKCPEHY